MIITKMMGGLGNQMFQYACGRALSLHLSTNLKLDIAGYDHQAEIDTPRRYELSNFSLVAQFASPREVARLTRFSYLPYLVNRFTRFKPDYHNPCHILEKTHNFDPAILKLKGNRYLEGYWQSAKYFQTYSKEIISDFTFSGPFSARSLSLLAEMKATPSLAIHARRGDYAHRQNSASRFFHLCSPAYYRHCLDYLNSRVSNLRYYIFSDDIVWAKKHIRPSGKVTYVSPVAPERSWEDLLLISACKHQIIANSTFSWWGAYLNNNPDKIVVSPKKWFRDKSIGDRDLIPHTWIRL